MGQYVSFDAATTGVQSLIDALIVADSGISVDMQSVTYQYGTAYDYYGDVGDQSSIAFYTAEAGDGLGIGSGLLLSSGTAVPNASNTSTGFSTQLINADGSGTDMTDADLSVTAQQAFSGSGSVYDATYLQFDFVISDLYISGITFDLVFGSEEYPEFSDSSFVDIAGIYLNGQNIALFNGAADQPLSVISKNISMGNFRDNSQGAIPIEYDGISNKLTVYAPLQPGVNTLKIAVSDTGDTILDSGLYVANIAGTQLGGDGLSAVTYGTAGDDSMVGTDDTETFDAGAGDDYIFPGFGNDIILGGDGNDIIIGGLGNNQIDGGAGVDGVYYESLEFLSAFVKVLDNHTLSVGKDSVDTMLNVEEVHLADTTLNADDWIISDDVAKVYVAYFGRAVDPAGLQYWLDQIKTAVANGATFSDSLYDVVSAFSDSAEAEEIYPGINSGSLDETQMAAFITNVYQNLFERAPEQAGLDYWVAEGMTLQQNGINVSTIVKTIIDGAQDQPENLDRTFMQSKSQVALSYAEIYEFFGKTWDDAYYEEAVGVLNDITGDAYDVDDVIVSIIGVVDGEAAVA